MNRSTARPSPTTRHGGAIFDEPDIGSGEKTPGQLDTEEDIKRIPALPQQRPGKPEPPSDSVSGS